MLLGGCRASPEIGIPATPGSASVTHSVTDQKRFVYTGKPQVFQVPANVHGITVDMLGASSAWQACLYTREGGNGGRVSALTPVTPHQKLWVYVGGASSGASGGEGEPICDYSYCGNGCPGYGGGGSGVNESSYDFGSGGGGGGGSGFAERKATQVRFWDNWKNATGDGLVVFTW